MSGVQRQRGDEARVPLRQPVRVKYASFRDFLTEVAANLSRGGMFLESDRDLAVGEALDFVLSLADGFTLVEGEGEVVWRRDRPLGPGKPAGVGIRFNRLLGDSQALIDRVVENHKTEADRFALERDVHESDSVEPREAPRESARLESARPESDRPEPEGSEPDGARPIEVALPPIPPMSPTAPGAPVPPVEAPLDFEAHVRDLVDRKLRSRVEESAAAGGMDSGISESGTDDAAPESEIEPVDPADQEFEDLEAAAPPKPEVSVPRPGGVQAELPTAASLGLENRPSALPEPERAPDDTLARVAVAAPEEPPLAGRRVFELTILAVVLGAFALLVFQLFWVRPKVERLEQGPAVPAESGTQSRTDSATGPRTGSAIAPSASAPVAGERSSSSVALPGEASAPDAVDPRATVSAWARAWSDRRVDDYLAFYAGEFAPTSGVGRRRWEERRRSRIESAGAIRVSVVAMQVDETGPDERIVRFTQSYQSVTYRDRVRKVLRLGWEGGTWKIREERVVRNLPW